ncbi:MAG: DUF1376 domain-containing protein [Patescibacteria group bacterium]|nr:DUF1376 domain-containing protein [Patescibacteria group bacterium]
MNPPAFQFYPDGFIGGTQTMTQNEVGAYILLLCHQWQSGKITSESDRLKMVAKGEVSGHVLSKFPGGKNKRLEEERKKQQIYREKQRINGALGGRPAKPKPNPSLSFGLTQTKPKKRSPSPSPSPFHKDHKASNKPFSEIQTELTARFHRCLNGQWENDRQKWMGRISRDPQKSERVVAELENAIKESRVKTTPAQFAEDTWMRFI